VSGLGDWQDHRTRSRVWIFRCALCAHSCTTPASDDKVNSPAGWTLNTKFGWICGGWVRFQPNTLDPKNDRMVKDHADARAGVLAWEP
jgi:hypothetical protein